jgi:hypothetical protein
MRNLQLACLVFAILVSVLSTGSGMMVPFEKDSGSKRFRINSFSPMDKNEAEEGQLRESENLTSISMQGRVNLKTDEESAKGLREKRAL